MAQDRSTRPEDAAPASPASDVTQDLGGVQGTPEDEQAEDGAAPAAEIGTPPDQPAPDAGEIEWAGQVVKKPPSPSA